MPPDTDDQNRPTDLAGYASVDELAKAYRSSSEEGKRQRQRADEMAQRAMELEQFLTRPQVPQREDAASRLAGLGVPVDALDEYVGSRVSQAVTQAFEPIVKNAMARNTMLSSYPDYQKYEAEVARFIQEDTGLSQTYSKMFSVEPVAAMEFAMLKYGEHQRRAHPSNGAPRPQEQARAEAQIPSSRAGDARNIPAAEDEMLTKTWEHYQKTGNPKPFAQARLRQVVSDEFLNR